MPRYRPGSVLFAGHQCALSYEQGIQWQVRSAIEAANNVFASLSERALASYFTALFGSLRIDGRIIPTRQDLADRMGVSVKTVDRCTKAAELLGLVAHTNRLKEVDNSLFQTSNSYVLLLPPLIRVPPYSFIDSLNLRRVLGPVDSGDNSFAEWWRHNMVLGEWLEDRWRRYMGLSSPAG